MKLWKYRRVVEKLYFEDYQNRGLSRTFDTRVTGESSRFTEHDFLVFIEWFDEKYYINTRTTSFENWTVLIAKTPRNFVNRNLFNFVGKPEEICGFSSFHYLSVAVRDQVNSIPSRYSRWGMTVGLRRSLYEVSSNPHFFSSTTLSIVRFRCQGIFFNGTFIYSFLKSVMVTRLITSGRSKFEYPRWANFNHHTNSALDKSSIPFPHKIFFTYFSVQRARLNKAEKVTHYCDRARHHVHEQKKTRKLGTIA